MIPQLRIRTEYSLRFAFGKIANVADHLKDLNVESACIADRGGTWGHIQWRKQCKELGIKPIYGVELAMCEDPLEKSRESIFYVTLIALNDDGVREIYEATSEASEGFYYEPRIAYRLVKDISCGGNVAAIVAGKPNWQALRACDNDRQRIYYGISTTSTENEINTAIELEIEPVICSDNLHIHELDIDAFDTIIPGSLGTNPRHITAGPWEYSTVCKDKEYLKSAESNTLWLGEFANADLPQAEMVRPESPQTVREVCYEMAESRGIDLSDPTYKQRLERELGLIEEKKFEDYFHVVADLCKWARGEMLVGPGRGSSAGSLVCFIMEITEVDPLKYDLLFERFIDLNRSDLPDIDIDFPHDRREDVIQYLKDRHGHDCVAKLGTISRYKPKSALTDVAKSLDIPEWEIRDLKDSIVQRSSGDARAALCIMDTFEQLDIGKRTLEKYPEIRVSEKVEQHARHSGQHAAGIIVTQHPMMNYCSLDFRNGSIQLDKRDAEAIDLLKIDVLALRTLAVLDHCLKLCGWSRRKLETYPVDDQKAFDILNDKRFAGIFQYEGKSLKSLVSQIEIDNIEQVIVITSLARPGPLDSGGTSEYAARENGKKEIKPIHPIIEDITKVSLGVIAYQEQVMQIARDVGDMTWEDVSALRKAMSKSMGKEFFNKYWEKFREGAMKRDLTEEEARSIWDQMNTMGSWAFNRSHAVAYGLISYWCCVLKAHHPLEFAAACLAHAKDDDQTKEVLKELVSEGYKYRPYDKELSMERWTLDRETETLIGPLTNIKGIGEKTAISIVESRSAGKPLTPRQDTLLSDATTDFDILYEVKELWGHIIENPMDYRITSRLIDIKDIDQDSDGTFVFIGKMVSRNLRDKNEYVNVQRRIKWGGPKEWKGQPYFLGLGVQDDESLINCEIGTYSYLKIGKPMLEEYSIGDWFIWKGKQRRGFRKIYVQRYVRLTGNPDYEPK